MATVQKLTTCFWFDTTAEDAASFYTSIFPDSRVTRISRFGDGGPMPKGTAMSVSFELAGQTFQALNGRPPSITFSDAISVTVLCDSQEEVDTLWSKLLSGGGKESQCGWLKDKFGLSWQVVPVALIDMITDADSQKAGRVMQSLMGMQKIDLAVLRNAHAGK